MIKNIKLSLIAVLLLFLGVSCSDYLDVKPMGRTIPKTAEEFDALIQRMLNSVDYGNSSLISPNSRLLSYECFADNLDMNVEAKSSDGSSIPNSLSTVYVGSELKSNTSKYTNFYEIIRDCNIIIENLRDDETRFTKNVLGTAYTIRAVAYLQLVKDFCDPVDKSQMDNQLGVPLVYSFDMEERPLRSSLSASIVRIEEDLNKALSFQVNDEIYRFTADVTRAYLAKLYFWSENWTQAITYSQYLLDKYPILRDTEYKTMMLSNIAQSGNMLIKSQIFSSSESSLIDETTMKNIKSKPLSKEFVELFTEKEKDIRFPLFVSSKRESIKKLLSCIRTDEMCLILAESYAHLNNEDKALYYLNHIREHRISDYNPYTLTSLPAVNNNNLIKEDAEGKPLTSLMQAILNERRKELYLEGDRWYELKRNGRPEFWRLFNNRTQKVTTQKFMYTFPIPIGDITIVDGLIQNPGYAI